MSFVIIDIIRMTVATYSKKLKKFDNYIYFPNLIVSRP